MAAEDPPHRSGRRGPDPQARERAVPIVSGDRESAAIGGERCACNGPAEENATLAVLGRKKEGGAIELTGMHRQKNGFAVLGRRHLCVWRAGLWSRHPEPG